MMILMQGLPKRIHDILLGSRNRRIIFSGSLTGLTVVGLGIYHGKYITTYDMKSNENFVGKSLIYYNALTRCLRVAGTVLRIAADYKWSLRNSITDSLSKEELDKTWSAVHLRSAERLLDTFKKNGGVFIKFGQHISALVYLLPEEYTNTMKELQDMCPESSFDAVKSVIEKDTGKMFEDIFGSFDVRPVGSASLAQVHKAKLKSGEVVAVKVQHYYVNYFAPFDIALTDFLVKVIKYTFPEFEFDWLADEMKQNLPLELDFIHEAENSKRLNEYFKNEHSRLKVPSVFWASKRTLCMEFIDGCRIDDMKYFHRYHINETKVFEELSKIFSLMIFKYGFVHCDPHPGNLMVRAKGKGQFDIVLLDHGLYKEMNDDFRADYAKVWLALLTGDEKGIKLYSERLGGGNAYIIFSCVLTARSWEAVTSNSLNSAKTVDEAEHIKGNAGNYIKEIAYLLANVPRPLLLLFKTNDLLRSIESILLPKSGFISYFVMFKYCTQKIFEKEWSSSVSIWDKVVVWSRYTFYIIYLNIAGVYMNIFSAH